MSFVGLHIHSAYSLLDGASQLPQLVARAKELDMPAIALTDHGVMYGAIELIKVCKGAGIKPIIGNEMYLINGDISQQQRRPRYHQVVLAKNTQGYKNLVKLTTISHLQGVQGKGIFSRPCINKDLLEQYHEGLIVTSACLGGEVPQAILQKRPDVARKVAQWYKDLFGEDYYLEIQDHGSPEDRVVNVELLKIAREMDVKIICTNDSHYISCNDVEAHDALLCIQTGKLLTEDKRLRYSGTEYLKSADEMRQLFRDHIEPEVIEESIANTLEVADKIEEYTGILGQSRIPDFPIPAEFNEDAGAYMGHVAREGLVKRMKTARYEEIDQEYRDRLEYEIEMMIQMGFPTYFLVVWDYIRFARDNNIPVGPGRGSAAGSLVAYAMEITNIDPIHHGLLFERFLNPERKSMPDIDTDFCIDRRDEVIKYVTRRYGEERVAQIITFNRMTSKAVLKDVARVLDIPYAESDRMAKLIPVARGKPTKLKVMISDDTPAPEFKEKYDNDPQTRRWIDMALRIEGTNKTFGMHAAGVVISKDPLDEIVPLQRNNDGQVITQYYMEDVEALGLLKMDFLGLRNLTMIQKTLELIEATHGTKIDPDDLPMDDPATYKLLERGDLGGVFQLESSGMRQIVKDLKPSGLEDISSVLALYRPGPLDAGLIPKFINRKHGREKIDFADEILKPILSETYGIMVYQEQIMKIAQDMGGYSLGQADLLRRAMGKKKMSEMLKHQENFVNGAMEKGVAKKVATELWDQMVKFAEYCFNKSHSTAYGFVTFQTAYLKANYPVEYMAALLTSNSGDQDKVQMHIGNCIAMGIEVLPPDINRSLVDFTPEDKSILFGLSAVRNVGLGAIECIFKNRESDGPFKSLPELCDRVDLHSVNRRALESLILAGALDKLDPNRNQLMQDLELVIDWAQSRAKDREIGQGNLFDMMMGGGDTQSATPSAGYETAPKAPLVADFEAQEKLRQEKELLGFYISDHPLKSVQRSARVLAPINLAELHEQPDNVTLSAIVILASVKPVVTKKGDRMAIVQLEDLTGQAEAVVFPKSFERIGQHIVADKRLMIWGKVDRRDDRVQFIIDDAESIEDVRMVMVELDPRLAGDIEQQHRLRNVIRNNQGDDPKYARVPVIAVIGGTQQRQFVRLGAQFRVKDPEAAVTALVNANFQAKATPLISA
ncbi:MULTISPECIES: DNA polymerase III subunit alpha [Cyanophyceae]|uniref:DNA polymerase III subunit alpha n=1 Tax=Cyanophyceae TaxID=3028117 RepID=UPI00168482D7|nr:MULTISPECIES: DNA polymerase III subunit alpha [Cyanophyceae]MBD1918439.1 DNA polymerase III subunit alpha [Phormidium sp. FACHB-77]MBD2028692.1 DNA polymerase III subunit alpha [Phormidium sp. FACHB-322]MBD2051113.1 DNA polymerase III subunit alpha [Leptolyngbya sp. FACHB-60]